MSQQEQEKVKIALEANMIPQSELEDLMSQKEDIWQSSGEGFSQSPFNVIKLIAPAFYGIVNEFINKEENQDKKVSFTLENYQFGISLRQNMKFMWKRSLGSGQQGGSGGNKNWKPALPLQGYFFDTWTAANNEITRNPSVKWYHVQQEIVQDPDDKQNVQCFVLMKQNKFT